MSGRKVVIARTGFTSAATNRLAGIHPEVVQTGIGAGAIRQGTRLWSDDEIVVANPTLFVDAAMVPGETRTDADPFGGWPADARGQTRERIWNAYNDLEKDLGERPTRERVAAKLNTTEPTLKRAQKDLGIAGWPPPRHPSGPRL
jgi:hypothetical protein